MRTLSILSFLCICFSVFSQLSEVAIENSSFSGANYPGVKYDKGIYALNDPFLYNPNDPTSDSPIQGWQSDGETHCFASRVYDATATLRWECDFVIDPGKELYALDLWGRAWQKDDGANAVLISSSDEIVRAQNLFLSITNGTTIWEVPGGEWEGVSSPGEGAYGRYLFQTADVPDEILKNGGHLIIERRNFDKTLYLHIDELRLAASFNPEGLVEADLSNPVLNGAKYPGTKFDLGRYALNDDFLYNPESPTESAPLQSWDAMNDTSHCFAYGTSENVSWECDINFPVGKELYALDFWGRIWEATSDGTYITDYDGLRSQNFHISITSYDGKVEWSVPGGSWEGASSPTQGAYGRYLFSSAGIPDEIAIHGGHLVIKPLYTADEFFHIDELRVVAFDAYNRVPVADAGEGYIVKGLESVTLDGSASFDNNDDALVYTWQSMDPMVAVENANASQTSFIAPEVSVATDYTFTLSVNDGQVDSDLDQVVFKVFPSDTNFIPIAVITAETEVTIGSLVTLDGSLSSDFEDDELTFLWKSLSGDIVLSDTISEAISFIAPNVLLDSEYSFSLQVNDGCHNSSTSLVTIVVSALNNKPVANAGYDVIMQVGESLILDGTQSSDIDGDILSYLWSHDSPAITLSSLVSPFPTLTVNESGLYELSLVVNDGSENSVASTISVRTNTAPIANPGSSRKVKAGDVVELDASASYDVEDDSISFLWLSKHQGLLVSSSSQAKVSFVAPIIPYGVYEFGLVVADSMHASAESIISISVNTPPVANAGYNEYTQAGETIQLLGDKSYDIDQDVISYEWSVVGDSGITLEMPNSENTSCVAPSEPGVYQFQLVVFDGLEYSEPSRVECTVLD